MRASDDRIRMVVETCLRHGIHRSSGFEGGANFGYRERIGNIMNGMSSPDARSELLQKLQAVSGARAAAAVQARLGEGSGLGAAAGGMMGNIAAMGGVLRSQAESVGSFIEQGAERLNVRR